MKIARSTVLLHSAKTQTKLLGRRLPNHNVFRKQKIINFFCKQTNNIQILNYKTVENFKPIWTYLASQETALIFMNVNGRYAKKKLGIFCFHKTLWLDNLLPSAPVWVSAL